MYVYVYVYIYMYWSAEQWRNANENISRKRDVKCTTRSKMFKYRLPGNSDLTLTVVLVHGKDFLDDVYLLTPRIMIIVYLN